MRRSFVILVLLCLAPSFGATETSPVEEEVDFEESKQIWYLTPQLSVISPREISLSNKAYDIPYAETLTGLPAFHLGAGTSLGEVSTSLGDFEFFGMARIGYTAKSLPVNLQSREHATERRSGEIKLHWVPLAGGVEIRYSVPGFPFVRPVLTAGGGVHWMYQHGQFNSVNDSFWIPHFFIMPGIAFFESKSPTDWFGGFTFGVTYQDSFASRQKVKTWSFDLSMDVVF
jgi:hypothetical protein